MELDEALRIFSAGGAAQERAFEVMRNDAMSILFRYLRLKDSREADHEDIISAVLIRVWERREGLKFPNVSHWRAYIKKAVDRALIDLRRSKSSSVTHLADISEIKSESLKVDPTEGIMDSLMLSTLATAADSLWLGEESEGLRLKVLAARLLYFDSLPVSAVLAVIARAGAPAAPRNEYELVNWLRDVRVVRTIAFEELSLARLDIVAAILGCDSHTALQVMQTSFESESAPCPIPDWTWPELAVLSWRFWNQEQKAPVLKKAAEMLGEERAVQILERCNALHPFKQSMEGIWTSFEQHELRAKALSGPGLWKRLVFRLISSGMSHADIVEWLGPASAIAGFRLEQMQLHAWISNKRIFDELETYMTKKGWLNKHA